MTYKTRVPVPYCPETGHAQMTCNASVVSLTALGATASRTEETAGIAWSWQGRSEYGVKSISPGPCW